MAVVLFAAYLAYRQMRTGNIIIGSDTIFHFNRFYETEEQIRNGNLSWFMTLYGFNQSGRVINAFYGPAFAYLNGLLLLAVGTWYRYQIITSFLVFAVGGVGMYRAVHRFKVRGSIAVLVTIIYMTIGWLPRWQSGSNFTGIGAALMPYGILVACDMFYDKEKPIHWIKLTILMTVALECHLLTALMYMAFLVPAWLYAIIKRENKRGILLNTLKAVLLTIFLTVNTLLPLYWMSKTNNLAANGNNEDAGKRGPLETHHGGLSPVQNSDPQPASQLDFLAGLRLYRPGYLRDLDARGKQGQRSRLALWRLLATSGLPLG
ncbi:6-pyruvoyl-tetrahydropterin synthase-related protein [Lactobacillus delbrueckii]|uniref:6-pyruvoyl-tetrahydropterin synthase-related protein n=1 Tax=Lactobacillus delbrueckii TaxID=1584 RepID=UPI003854B14E